MDFDSVFNSYMSTLDEGTEDTIALIPGSFKPPHKGHYAMIKHFSDIAERVIVVISDPKSEKSIRRTPAGKKLDGQQARSIFDIYTKTLPNVELIVSPQPVKWVYDFVKDDTTPGERILLGVSGKGEDAKRYVGAQKYAPEGVTVEPSVFNDSDLNISASDFRNVIDEPTLATINQYIPDHLNDKDKEYVLGYLSQIEESI